MANSLTTAQQVLIWDWTWERLKVDRLQDVEERFGKKFSTWFIEARNKLTTDQGADADIPIYTGSLGLVLTSLAATDIHWSRDTVNGYVYPKTITDKIGINTIIPAAWLDVMGDFKLLAGVTVDTIEDTLTDDSTHVASSHAIWTAIAATEEYVDSIAYNIADGVLTLGRRLGIDLTQNIDHKDRHDPEDGGDALDTAAASEISVVVAAGVGTSHSFARADHIHAISHAITNNHLVTIDSATVTNLDYAKFTASGLEGRNYAEVRSDLSLDTYYVPRGLVNGTFVESFNSYVTSDGTTVSASLEQVGGGDLTMQFSDGNTTLDCTPALSITLTHGTDSIPQENYLYVPLSTKVLTLSTTGWPLTEHIKVTYVLCPSAASVLSDGAYINQNWNDHLEETNGMGHLTNMAERSRRDGAYYFSGVDPLGTTSYLTCTAGSVTVQMSAGVIYQMHKHNYAAKDTLTGDDIHVVNSPTPYREVSNLYDLTLDASGGTLTNKFFNIVLWGVANKGGTYSPVMVNLPTGTYNTIADANADIDGHTVYSMPRYFSLDSSTGFLIARITVRKIGGTWTWFSTLDLRGKDPTFATGGGSGSILYEYPDSLFKIYDNLSITKIFQFVADGLTAGVTRLYTAPDKSGTLALLSDIGTLDTTATLTQVPSASESFSSSITLHKVAKTGTYTDLLSIPSDVSTYLSSVDATNISSVIFTLTDASTITESFSHVHTEYALYNHHTKHEIGGDDEIDINGGYF